MSGFDMAKRRGFAEMDRVIPLTDEDGKPLQGSANAEVVKSDGPAFEKIDAAGGQDTTELAPEPVEESREHGGEDLFRKYLETIFRNFPGEITRAGAVSDRAMADRVKLTQGKGEYIYIIPAFLADEMKSRLDKSVSFGVEDPGIEFSQMVGLDKDVLDDNGLGFTRQMEIGGEVFTVKFIYGKQKTESGEQNLSLAA